MSTDNITVADLEVMAHAANYRRWMYGRLERFIGRRILEVGAGIGNFTSLLLDRELVVAIDTYLPCVRGLAERFADRPNLVPLHLDIADPAAETLRRYDIDTVVCLNVLEHIADDRLALTRMRRILKPGGRLVLLVPALQFLYGTIDRALGHYRRYGRHTLRHTLTEGGFHVERVGHMNALGVAGWFLNNRILRKREESLDQVLFFDRFIAPWAERVERLVPPPIGLSLIAIARPAVRPL
jgi:SAM-dependent methyltransferase